MENVIFDEGGDIAAAGNDGHQRLPPGAAGIPESRRLNAKRRSENFTVQADLLGGLPIIRQVENILRVSATQQFELTLTETGFDERECFRVEPIQGAQQWAGEV